MNIFQLQNTDHNGLITLQSLECRTLTCLFCPTVIGPAVGKLEFIHTVDNQSRAIHLNAYGGHTSVQIEGGVQHGSVGLAFLPLGNLHQLAQNKKLEKTFIINNSGSLPAFIYIDVENKMRDLVFGLNSIQINPKLIIIPPGYKQDVRVTYKPQSEEVRKLLKRYAKALVIGYISIFYGDEITRNRIRNILKHLKVDEEHAMSKPLMNLCTNFPNEKPIDLSMLNERKVRTLSGHFILFNNFINLDFVYLI